MTEILFAIIASGVSLVALYVSISQFRYQKKRDNTLDIAGLRSEVVSLRERASRLEASNELAWKMMEMYAGKILHHPETPHIDWYIDKNQDEGLTVEEAREFALLLRELIEGSSTSGEKAAATLMLAALSYRHHIQL